MMETRIERRNYLNSSNDLLGFEKINEKNQILNVSAQTGTTVKPATMTLPEIIGLTTGIIGIVSVIVAVTRYLTQLQLKNQLNQIENKKLQAEKLCSELKAKNKDLLEELTMARSSGGVLSAKKEEIENDLCSLMRLVSAESGSVYIPLHDDNVQDQVVGLIFLTIKPLGEKTIKLRKEIIPVHNSIVGRCFTEGRPLMVANAKSSQDHYEKADKISGYSTRNTVNVPLKRKGKIIGVLQLLNKQGDENFSEQDLANLQQFSKEIAEKVEAFSQLPGSIESLAVNTLENSQYATIMFCDLTASSVLFQELNVSEAIRLINNYLEELCKIAFSYGATVDKYMGDGVLFRFNVPHPVANHPLKAIQAALKMQIAFNKIKESWVRMDGVLEKLYTRTGIAYGPVQKAIVGHPQYQYLTIFGRAVNTAFNLCENGTRERNVIIIDELLYEQISPKVSATKIPLDNLGKAEQYTSSAYEINGIVDNL
jgi:class 3 adenylate cyclase